MDVGFGLLVADRGGWHCLAIVSAAWDCFKGRCLQHQRHRTAWLELELQGIASRRHTRCSSVPKQSSAETDPLRAEEF